MHVRLHQLAATLVLFAINASASVLYVDLNSSNPTPPYTNWTTAATNIQDAVDAANAADTVLVTNGLYATGGRRVFSTADVTNRVAITNAITVRSVNGPAVTAIQGYQVSSGSNLNNAIRCALLSSNAVLSGFTLTNGSAGTGNYCNGGGVAGPSGPRSGGIVANCVLVGNYAKGAGGGALDCILIGCVLSSNLAVSGGAAMDSTLINCRIVNNTAMSGGGAEGCLATNCLFTGNHATNSGGASAFSTLVNCTVVSNVLQPGYPGYGGGGSYHDTLFNSIIYGNTAPNGSNYFASSITFCCTAPLAAGPGNIETPPLLNDPAAGDFHLQSSSPCINAGDNTYAVGATDLDGRPRIQGGTVDIGAYEFQPGTSALFIGWLQQYGLPRDGSADFIDTDGDGMNNWQEWTCGTDPTNSSSALRITAPSRGMPGITAVQWQSVSGKTYCVQRGTNLLLSSAFSSIQSNIVGQAGTTSFTDTNATGTGPYFYRVGVQ